VGPKNGGWTIAKRLLQHERSTLSRMGSSGASSKKKKGQKRLVPTFHALADAAVPYVGREPVADSADPTAGRLADPQLRDQIVQQEMDGICFGLTMKRSGEEAKAGHGPGHSASLGKYYGSELNMRRQELMVSIMGTQALGWEGEGFTPAELMQARSWLRSKGNSIEGGTSEVQLNVVAKRVLELPD
jgi:alkylation response protein AidB-like acyl-CoA dehydrogenase